MKENKKTIMMNFKTTVHEREIRMLVSVMAKQDLKHFKDMKSIDLLPLNTNTSGSHKLMPSL